MDYNFENFEEIDLSKIEIDHPDTDKIEKAIWRLQELKKYLVPQYEIVNSSKVHSKLETEFRGRVKEFTDFINSLEALRGRSSQGDIQAKGQIMDQIINYYAQIGNPTGSPFFPVFNTILSTGQDLSKQVQKANARAEKIVKGYGKGKDQNK